MSDAGAKLTETENVLQAVREAWHAIEEAWKDLVESERRSHPALGKYAIAAIMREKYRDLYDRRLKARMVKEKAWFDYRQAHRAYYDSPTFGRGG